MRPLILGAVLSFFVPILALAEKPMAPERIEGVQRVDAEGVIQLILAQPELIVIDARKDEEYAKGHIEGAVSLLDTRMTPEALNGLAAHFDTPILFYCNGARCLRSSHAATLARQWGYSNIYWFRGGWAEWQEKKLPIEK